MTSFTRRQCIIALLGSATLLGTGLAGWHHFFPGEKTAYITASASRMDIEEKVLASGTLTALKTVEVGAQVSGQLKKLHVALGDQVKKGELLAEIDPVLQLNSLRDAQASLANVLAQKRSKEALLRQYALAYKRQGEMVAQDATAAADLEGAQAQLEGARADIAALDAQIAKAKIAVDTANANLDYTRIQAPMDGVVISIVTEEGQTVVSAQAAPTILKLANLGTMTVKAQISEADVSRVKPGQTVYFTTLGDADTRHYAKLRALEPGPDASSTSSSSSSTTNSAIYYNGLFEVPNPDGKLRVSMTAQVSIVLGEKKQALCIPASALGPREKDGRYGVRVLREGRTESRSIRVGMNNNVQAEVLEGLKEGDKVIIGDSSTLPALDKSQPGPPRRG
jgi:membrane fusion protein, macrolide-specific efflux system